jgi:hypothetical protein
LTGDLLQMPLLAALRLLSWWIAVGEKNPNGWMSLGLLAALSLYAGPQGVVLLAVLSARHAVERAYACGAGQCAGNVRARRRLLIFAHAGAPRLLWLWFHSGDSFLAGARRRNYRTRVSISLATFADAACRSSRLSVADRSSPRSTPAKSKEQRAGVRATTGNALLAVECDRVAILPAAFALLWLYLSAQNTRPAVFFPRCFCWAGLPQS